MTKVTKNNFKLRPELRDMNVRSALITLHRLSVELDDTVERLIDYDGKDYVSSSLKPEVRSSLGMAIFGLRFTTKSLVNLHAKYSKILDEEDIFHSSTTNL